MKEKVKGKKAKVEDKGTIGALIRQKSQEIDTLRILKKEHGAKAQVEVAGDGGFIVS